MTKTKPKTHVTHNIIFFISLYFFFNFCLFTLICHSNQQQQENIYINPLNKLNKRLRWSSILEILYI